MKQKVLFDCDNTMGLRWKEIDDGLTLLYLLGRDDFDLLGITTTFGNGSLEEVWQATTSLLRYLGREDIVLKKGNAERGLAPTEAAEFLVEMVNRYPGEINLLATGPLGNLGAACQLDPGFFSKVKQVVCMGGMTKQPMRLGWRQIQELNFSANPEATQAVLQAQCPVTVMNAEICLQAPFLWRHALHLKGWDSLISRWRNLWHLGFGLHFGIFAFYLWDLLPAVFLNAPELFHSKRVRIDTSLENLARGDLVNHQNGSEINMPDVILDREGFYGLLFTAWEDFFKTR